MKIYIAARAKTQEQRVKEVVTRLKAVGHSITYDWASENKSILKPHRQPLHRQRNESVIPKMLNAAADADIFILLDEPGLRGAYVELGAFLHNSIKRPQNRRVYIVGPNSHEREHIFESPEFVRFVDSIEEVYKDLKYI